jgi:hypothetical protein
MEGNEVPVVVGGRDEPLKEDESADPEVAAAIAAHTPAQPIEIPESLEGLPLWSNGPCGPERRQTG